jgi:hypothetical protein
LRPSILDGNDGLSREVRNKLNLLVGEWLHLLAINVDGTDNLALLEHWYCDMAPGAA